MNELKLKIKLMEKLMAEMDDSLASSAFGGSESKPEAAIAIELPAEESEPDELEMESEESEVAPEESEESEESDELESRLMQRLHALRKK